MTMRLQKPDSVKPFFATSCNTRMRRIRRTQIVKWWLPHTGYEDSPRHIEAVLEEMVNKHWLRREVLPDGEILYLRGDACGI